jgi:hypothetical protein
MGWVDIAQEIVEQVLPDGQSEVLKVGGQGTCVSPQVPLQLALS